MFDASFLLDVPRDHFMPHMGNTITAVALFVVIVGVLFYIGYIVVRAAVLSALRAHSRDGSQKPGEPDAKSNEQ